jgi:hypothetical protein
MADEFVKLLDAEIADLEAAIKADPRIQKLEDARRLRARYPDGCNLNPPARVRRIVSVSRNSSRSPKNQAILDCAAGRIEPTSTNDVYNHISGLMEIPGANPKNNLAAMLSNSPRFRANGRQGWVLATETNEASDTLFLATSEASNPIAASLTAEPNVKPVNPALGGGA